MVLISLSYLGSLRAPGPLEQLFKEYMFFENCLTISSVDVADDVIMEMTKDMK